MSSSLVAGSFSGVYFGWIPGLMGSMTPATVTYYGTCLGIYSGETAGQISVGIPGDVTSTVAGTKLVIDGVDCAYTDSEYDSGTGNTSIHYARATGFSNGVTYAVDIVSAGGGGPTVNSGAGAITAAASIAATGRRTAGAAGTLAVGGTVAATGRVFKRAAGTLTGGATIAGTACAIAPASGTIAGSASAAAIGQAIVQAVGTLAFGATVAGPAMDAGSSGGGSCLANTLTAGSNGTQRGYREDVGGMGSVTPDTWSISADLQRIYSDTGTANQVIVRFGDNTGAVYNQLNTNARLYIDGAEYGPPTALVWDDGDLWTQATYSTPGFAFVHGSTYCVDVDFLAQDTGAGHITASLAVFGHARSIASGAGTIALGAALSATGQSTAAAAGTLTGGATVAGQAGSFSSATGTIAAGGIAAGTLNSIQGANGSISISASIAGIGTMLRVATGTISASFVLAGTAGTVNSAAGTISASFTITGQTGSFSAAAGTISAGLGVAGSAGSLVSAAGNISLGGAVAATGIIAVRIATPTDRYIELTNAGERTITLTNAGSRYLEL